MTDGTDTRRRLERRRDEVRARLRMISLADGTSREQDWLVPDLVDRAQESIAEQQRTILSDSLAGRVQSLDRALDKLDAGTYGICEACGAEISRRRLEARPDAILCVSCQERRERRAGAA